MALRGWRYRAILEWRPVGNGPGWWPGTGAHRYRGSYHRVRQGRSAAYRRAVAVLMAALAVIALLGWGAGRYALPSLWAVAESRAVLVANEAIYRALSSGLAEIPSSSLLRVERDPTGNPRYVEPDVNRLQSLAARFLAVLQEEMAQPEAWEIRLPLGQLLGTGLWSGWGPMVPARVIPTGKVQVDFRDTFSGAGINQTKYSLYLDVVMGVTVVAPFWNKWVETRCSLPVAQMVIVGSVPPGLLYQR